MIRVENLTRRYGSHQALAGLSFHVEKGEIVGFLGPNGAGKTTAMRILTCFLPPSSGRAEVAGFDVFSDPMEVRRRVGYMPESVPLYPEMRVREYLEYRARLKRVPRSVRSLRVERVIERCGVGEFQRKLIGALSKGMRQRVGLADALIHEPPILILDEPTAGLDPNQIREVRALVRELGREHTVVLSTHILPEVEVTCGRVVILNRGRVLAEDTPDGLRRVLERRGRLRVALSGADDAALRERLGRVEGVAAVEPSGQPGTFLIEAAPDRDVREGVFRAAVEGGLVLLELSPLGASLEDVFVEITTREAHDASAGEASA